MKQRQQQLILLAFISLVLEAPFMAVALNEEGQILLRIKLSMVDEYEALSNWNPGDATPCGWFGVTCGLSPGDSSVTSLDLFNANISGPFPAALICSLPNLSFLSLSYNYIAGPLPPDSFSAGCRSLRHLDLSQNLLVGPLPESLPRLPSLIFLDLTGNNFSGAIPPSFAAFPKLECISLVANLLTGALPPFLGEISTLRQLNLSYNLFTPSPIPAEYGGLARLEVLWLAGCNLVGPIPPTLGNLGNLLDLDLSYNRLSGFIPQNLTLLSNVVQIELYNNSLSGALPRTGMENMKSLRRFDASLNNLEGEIPDELCALPLESLNLYENQLVGGLPESISLSPNLKELRLFGNELSGALPTDLGRNSPLVWIDLSDNMFSGAIPERICRMGFLQDLLLIGNSLSGGIPESLADCRSLSRVRLRGNQLSGRVPEGFWGLPHLSLLELSENSLSGPISARISFASNLTQMMISNNGFTGSIPGEIGSLVKLVELSANGNLLHGPVPASIGHLTNLEKLDLHHNLLSGSLPSEIRFLKKLAELNLAGNKISGRIPKEIGELVVLDQLDLSGNSLSGEIPIELQNLKLNKLNLSSNRLLGQIPPLFAKAAYRRSFLGNPDLCLRSLIGMCPLPHGKETRSSIVVWTLRAVLILAGLVLLFGIGCFHHHRHKHRNSKLKKIWTLTSFQRLGFSEFEILEGIDERNEIGSGASGTVYRVVLSSGEAVAVKKLSDGATKKGGQQHGFEAEVATLGRIRHRNIVKLWCSFSAGDSRLLVYEYMPNGSLEDLLHGCKSGPMEWPMRCTIASDVAQGLSYLHHDCAPPIVHRDVKSSNILLDADFGARLADFGVAKVADEQGRRPDSMSVVAGSFGYIAPEYAYNLRVSEKSDVYSFGVVLLELVTGKRPVDPEYGEKDLVKWVWNTLNQKGVDLVIDPNLDIRFKEEICKVLSIGLLCTSPLPINRPSMQRVVKMLGEIGRKNKHKFVATRKHEPT